jgi:hypothetical protein
MHSAPNHAAEKTFTGFFRWVCTGIITFALIACGGGSQTETRRPLSADFTARKAVSYSPFRSNNRDTETITSAMIKQDLDLLVAGGFGLIRLFDSSDKVAKATLDVIRTNNLNVKVMLGVWIASGQDAANQAEIARGVALAKTYSDIVQAVSVGNETMVYWSFNAVPPATMASYIGSVRSQITQPVTTDDNWAFYATAPKSVVDVIDFAAVHTYPSADSVYNTWDWKQTSVASATRATAMMDAAIAAAKKDYIAVRNTLNGLTLTPMPIVIGETGWQAVNTGNLQYLSHPVNQKMYYERLATWLNDSKTADGPKNIVYFEAFDEPWKGADDKWGLFNVNRQARYVIQALQPASSTWVYEPGNFTATDALFYTAPVSSTAITAAKYTLYADAVQTGSEVRPSTADAVAWNAWDAAPVTATGAFVTSTAAPADGPNSFEITPLPKSWGWGFFYGSTVATAANLSNYAAAGHLHFSVKTTYPDKLEVGIHTGTASGGAVDAYLALANTDYGYCNTGAWCDVSIPLSALINGNAGDLALVDGRFVIADRFATTGKTAGTTGLPKVYVDNIYFSNN